MKLYLTFLLIFAAIAAGCRARNAEYESQIAAWRAQHAAELQKDDGWLTVSGLYWLNEGLNPVGRGPDFAVQLSDNFKQGKFGEIDFHDGKATVRIEPGVEATVDGTRVTETELLPDVSGKPTRLVTGSQTLTLIKRGDRYGIRIRDTESPARKNFAGLHWFPVDESLRVEAVMEPGESEIDVPNVLGMNIRMKSPGVLKFVVGGREFALQPVDEEDKLFIIFRDLTSRSETYQGGRFLYAERPAGGKVILDFNKAENPPCAYTQFATCPLPPPQNQLDIEIKAGEKRFDH